MITEVKNIAAEMHVPSIAARDWVFQVIRTAIIRGVLPCNMPLRQDEISDALNVSHIPVREAFRQLEANGLVRIYPNRGAVVSALTKKELSEMSDVLSILESTTLASSVENLEENNIDNIKSQFSEIIDKSTTDNFVMSNLNFHILILKQSNNQTAIEIIDRLRANIDRYLPSKDDEVFEIPSLINEHKILTELYLNRDIETLKDMFIKHIEHEKEVMLKSKFLTK